MEVGHVKPSPFYCANLIYFKTSVAQASVDVDIQKICTNKCIIGK